MVDSFEDRWNIVNYISTFTVDFLVLKYWGWGAFLYLAGSIVMAGSLHPCAAHFIGEHFSFVEADESTTFRPGTLFEYLYL